MKNTKRLIAMVMLVVVVFGTMSFASASVWRTGDFTRSGWTTYHYVYLTNSNRTASLYLHTYACAKGTGHSGACQNKALPSGTVRAEVRKSNGSYLYTLSYNGRQTCRLNISGVSSFKLRFAGTTLYQHWGIEGFSNVRSIS